MGLPSGIGGEIVRRFDVPGATRYVWSNTVFPLTWKHADSRLPGHVPHTGYVRAESLCLLGSPTV